MEKRTLLLGAGVIGAGVVGYVVLRKATKPEVVSVPGPTTFVPTGAPAGGGGDVTPTGGGSNDAATAALVAALASMGGTDTGTSKSDELMAAFLATQKDTGDKQSDTNYKTAIAALSQGNEKAVLNHILPADGKLWSGINAHITYDDMGRVVDIGKTIDYNDPRWKAKALIDTERSETIKARNDLQQAKLNKKTENILKYGTANPNKKQIWAVDGKPAKPAKAPKPKPKAKAK